MASQPLRLCGGKNIKQFKMFLVAQHIEKSYGTYKALDDVCLEVREGSIFGLLGPNGAGKTTLIRIINRISRADKGEILLENRQMTDRDVQQIGYLPEERGLYRKMKVGEQAVYLAQLKGLARRDAERRLMEWFDKFEIGGWWNRRVEELSKGMQQKIQFIVTVLHEPRLLIFDEPFSGFDPLNATLLKNEILQLKEKGATVIFSTHNMASVEELCDDIALINRSKVVLGGSVDEIRRSYSRNIYQVEIEGSPEGLQLPSWCRQIEACDGHSLKLSLGEGKRSNDLLGVLLPQCNILSFSEVLPSMNDIFIANVKKGGDNE